MLADVVIILLLLFFSGFFSGAETAFFSISTAQHRGLHQSKRRIHKIIAFLLHNSQQLLITIIAGNTVVNVTLASFTALLTHSLAGSYQLSPQLVIFLDVVAVTLVLLIVSEIIPKIVAIENSLTFAGLTAYPLVVIYFLFFPLAFIANKMIAQLQQSLLKGTQEGLSDEEIKKLVEVGAESGALEEDESAMLTSLFEFGETIVKEIMVPRPDMVCLDKNASFSQVMEVIIDTMFSRIPVYHDKTDDIIGILYVKDLLPYLGRRKKESFKMEKLIHPPVFVPESKRIQELLKEFQEEKNHMAIVVDEYGAVQGLVTLEDVIEEIVGEIQDEYDQEELLFKQTSKNNYLVSGKMDIEELEEKLGVHFEFEDEDIETIGGFLLNLLQNIPAEGETVTYKNLKFRIVKVSSYRITQVVVEKQETV